MDHQRLIVILFNDIIWKDTKILLGQLTLYKMAGVSSKRYLTKKKYRKAEYKSTATVQSVPSV